MSPPPEKCWSWKNAQKPPETNSHQKSPTPSPVSKDLRFSKPYKDYICAILHAFSTNKTPLISKLIFKKIFIKKFTRKAFKYVRTLSNGVLESIKTRVNTLQLAFLVYGKTPEIGK